MFHRLKPSLAGLALLLAAATLPNAMASSTATSSASDSLAASVGSISDSVKGLSNSSSRATNVAEGDYTVMEVATVAEKPGTVRMKLQAVAATPGADAAFFLYVPQQAFDTSGLAQEQTVSVRQRPYGVEFANGQTQQAFFLALNDAWFRELQSNAVSL